MKLGTKGGLRQGTPKVSITQNGKMGYTLTYNAVKSKRNEMPPLKEA